VKHLLDMTPETRQTLLFSATLDGAVDALVRRYQRDPVRHVLPETAEDKLRATHIFWKVERDERKERQYRDGDDDLCGPRSERHHCAITCTPCDAPSKPHGGYLPRGQAAEVGVASAVPCTSSAQSPGRWTRAVRSSRT
jgi:hypothetical protein